jgi:hypothetical protein
MMSSWINLSLHNCQNGSYRWLGGHLNAPMQPYDKHEKLHPQGRASSTKPKNNKCCGEGNNFGSNPRSFLQSEIPHMLLRLPEVPFFGH